MPRLPERIVYRDVAPPKRLADSPAGPPLADDGHVPAAPDQFARDSDQEVAGTARLSRGQHSVSDADSRRCEKLSSHGGAAPVSQASTAVDRARRACGAGT